MSIKSLDFNGDLTIITNNAGTVGVDRLEFSIKNSNSFDLQLRIVLIGVNNTKIVSTNSIVIGSNSGWAESHLPIYSSNSFTLFLGTISGISIEDVLANVVETKIIHSTSLSVEGEIVTGMLEIDNIGFLQLLSVEENFLKAIQVYPNPVVDQLFINFPQKTKGTLTLTSIDGKQLLSQELTSAQMQLDVSKIKSQGVYFLKIETASGIVTKRIVKS